MDAYLSMEIAIACLGGIVVSCVITYFICKTLNTNAITSLCDEHAEIIQQMQSSIDSLNDELGQQRNAAAMQAQQYEFLNSRLIDSDNQLHAVRAEQTQYKQRIQSEQQTAQLRLGRLEEQAEELVRQQSQNTHLREQLDKATQDLASSRADLQAQTAGFEQERLSFSEKIALLNEAEKTLSTQFENLANKIFEQKAEHFNRTNESGINTLIKPLKTQIDDFKRQINEQYIKEGQERASLKTEIMGLQALNKQITEEAAALTNALKGDNKQQGNWGEMVLETILSESGLRNGHEYETQKSLKDEQGKRFQPDVVVHLPNEKDIVIDSKVSLVAFERYSNSEDSIDKEKALKEHINSLKGHIKGLSKKDYQALEGVKTLDYVLMFIPIEGAFIAAVEHDPSLIKLALDNQIMMVSPTNLLVALRTVNNIWQYEYQNQNANRIAEQARKLYEKFVGFVGDMDKLGKVLESAHSTHESAMNKLSKGRGALIGQAEKFKTLGVQPTKTFDTKHLEEDLSDD